MKDWQRAGVETGSMAPEELADFSKKTTIHTTQIGTLVEKLQNVMQIMIGHISLVDGVGLQQLHFC